LPLDNMTTLNKGKTTPSTATAVHPQIFLRESDALPPPIDGTIRLVFLSDTHGNHDRIPLPLPEGDILFHLGDASNRGNMSDMRSFVQWMKKNSFHRERIVIDGNHDRDIVPRKGRLARDFMAEYEGVATVLRNEVIEVADGRMAVAGVTWGACEREDFREAKDNIRNWSESAGENKKRVDLVLSHLPPYLEREERGWHGSNILSHFVKAVNPPLHCFGHIHYARGVRRASNSGVMMLNCASTWNEPVVVDYCPREKRASMIHCPVSEASVKEHIRSSWFPRQFLVTEDEMELD